MKYAQIIFKFGEHYYENESSWIYDLTITAIGAFIGFGLSLLLYYLQLRNDKKKEQLKIELAKRKEEEKKKSDQLNLLKYFKELLISVRSKFETQLDKVDKYIEEQGANLTEMKGLYHVATEDFNRLRNIDNRGVFEAFVEQIQIDNPIRRYKEINGSLDYLEKFKKEIDRIYHSVSDQSYNKLIIVKDIIDHIPDVLSGIAEHLIRELGDNRMQDNYYVFINSAVLKYHELIEGRANFEIFNTEYLEPILQEYVNNFNDKPEAHELMTLCKKARVKLNDVRVDVQGNIDEFSTIREMTSESINCLNEAIEALNRLENQS